MPVTEARPFEIHVEDAQIEDLHRRLAATRWPIEPEGNDQWEWGTNLEFMHRLIDYWGGGFDWRAQEAALNRFPHYHAEITGENDEVHTIHFVWERGSGSHPRALILTHGWPSTFVEFVDAIEPLAHPERFGGDAEQGFDVVVPSCPGFGFSSQPRRPMGPRTVAYLWDRLMHNVLGYPRYIAQGGDFGGYVTEQMGLQHAEHLYGVHLTSLPLVFRLTDEGQGPLTEAEQAQQEARAQIWRGEDGYSRIQGTKPMSLGYALTDSPAGLAAWIAEKFHRWSDVDRSHPYQGFEARVPMDQLLTNISIYWFTGTINSANNIYKAGLIERSARLQPGQKVEVPAGFADYPSDLDVVPHIPRSWAERSHRNLVHYAAMPRGGHFAALAEPELFAEDIRAFASKLPSDN